AAEISPALLRRAVSAFLSPRDVARRNWSRALAVVRVARARFLSRDRARATDDRRFDGLVYHWVSRHCGTAFARCASAWRCRSCHALCNGAFKRVASRGPKPDCWRPRFSRPAAVLSRRHGNASARCPGFAAAAFCAGAPGVLQWHCRDLFDRGGKVDGGGHARESTRLADVE